MELITKTETVIDVSDWDDFVTHTYGRPYSFQQQDGCKSIGSAYLTVYAEIEGFEIEDEYTNDTVPEEVNHEEMGVSFKAWLARDPKQQLDNDDEWEREHGLRLWWDRNFYPSVEMIADDLRKRGLMEVGEYTINIDW